MGKDAQMSEDTERKERISEPLSPRDFMRAMAQQMQQSVLKQFSECARIEYRDKHAVPRDIIDGAWALVDRDKLRAQLAARLEKELADRIVNHLATEISTDIKSILSVRERREALRAIARENIESIVNIPAS